MKRLLMVLMLSMLAISACAVTPVDKQLTAGYETTLDATALYLSSVFDNAQTTLELIAATPAAKKGDWEGIKPYLVRQQSTLPGVYFFVLPNGNYYSTEKDYTNLNLSDRAYFSPLFAGNPVRGAPIYSRSSGKKSALVAVPVVTNDQIVGALGISIFLDELVARVNRAIALPQDYTWFVLNAEGVSMLDSEPEFIFMDALTQGSASLQKAVTEALKHESGKTQYVLETPRYAIYQKLEGVEWWMFLARIDGGKIPIQPQQLLSLEQFVPELQSRLLQMDRTLSSGIESSNVEYDKESEVRALLVEMLVDNINIVEASYVDRNGILRYIEPREYRNFEHADVSNQAHVVAMRNKPVPTFTSGFMAVEDFLAVLDSHPVYDDEKRFAGTINLLIRPELLITPLLGKTIISDSYELWVMQTDGMIIYDQDKEEMGKMLFSDPLYDEYPGLRELGKTIASSRAGEGTYVFLAPGLEEKVIKNVIWSTVELHQREWRVVLAHRPYESPP